MITIIATISITLCVLYLGLTTWAIVRLTRKVSKLEGLRNDMENHFQGLYRQFDDLDRNHGEKIKDLERDLDNRFRDVFQNIDEHTKELDRRIDDLNRNYDEHNSELYRQLDKRFDTVYRKLLKNKKD